MFEVHISKHSLFRLKITVGCLTSTYPSIHFSLDEDTLKITVGCLVSTYPSIHKNPQDHGRLSEVLWCVGVLCVVWVHEGVVLCDELCVVLSGVLRGGGVVWCVGVFSLSFSLFLSLSLSFSLSLFLSLNSLLSLSRSLSFFLVLSFFSLVFLFLFSLLPLSLLSSLLANKHCVKH